MIIAITLPSGAKRSRKYCWDLIELMNFFLRGPAHGLSCRSWATPGQVKGHQSEPDVQGAGETGESERGGGAEAADLHMWHRDTDRTGSTGDSRGQTGRLAELSLFSKMSGIAAKLQHDRQRSRGIGSNSRALKYLNQDFEALRSSCLGRGRLFEDDCFGALPSSLGFDELGPNSHKVRGITWKRPTVGKGRRMEAALTSHCWKKNWFSIY